MAAKRARQINAYYSQLGEGLLEYVGPLVETHVQEKPLSIALREINERHAHRRATTAERRPPDASAGAHAGAHRPRASAAGIAAYKACELLRLLTESGHDVRVVPDPRRAAVRRRGHLGGAVRPPGRPPTSGTTSHEVPHVRLGQEADLVVVAPATADLLARAAAGLADDLLTTPC